MSSSDSVLDFIAFLASVDAQFRRTRIAAEKSTALRDVSTMVIPFKAATSDDADNGVTISVALNAELRRPLDSERRAIGMSLLLRRVAGSWIADSEVAWSGKDIGWDAFDAKELQTDSLESLMVQVPAIVDWASARFAAEVAKLV
jgi:hypothetical protein